MVNILLRTGKRSSGLVPEGEGVTTVISVDPSFPSSEMGVGDEREGIGVRIGKNRAMASGKRATDKARPYGFGVVIELSVVAS